MLNLAIVIVLLGVVNMLACPITERTRERPAPGDRPATRTVRSWWWSNRDISIIGALLGTGARPRPRRGAGFALTSPSRPPWRSRSASPRLHPAIGVAGVLASVGPARRAARLDILIAIPPIGRQDRASRRRRALPQADGRGRAGLRRRRPSARVDLDAPLITEAEGGGDGNRTRVQGFAGLKVHPKRPFAVGVVDQDVDRAARQRQRPQPFRASGVCPVVSRCLFFRPRASRPGLAHR